MYYINKQILSLLLLFGSIFGQFIENIPKRALPSNINGELDEKQGFASLFDPYKFNIQHGFSMSMTSIGGYPVSAMAYNTNISYFISENMAINTNIILMNTAGKQTSNKNMGYQNFQLGYDASFIYKPTDRSFIKFELKSLNVPFYQNNRTRPYYSNLSYPR